MLLSCMVRTRSGVRGGHSRKGALLGKTKKSVHGGLALIGLIHRLSSVYPPPSLSPAPSVSSPAFPLFPCFLSSPRFLSFPQAIPILPLAAGWRVDCFRHKTDDVK